MRKEKQRSSNAIKDWGILDFRDEKSYPRNFDQEIEGDFKSDLEQKIYTPKQVEEWGWRWEFLRRSPLYREYWLKYSKALPDKFYIHPAFQFFCRLPDPRKPFSKKVKFDDFRHLGIEGSRHRKTYTVDFSFKLEPQLNNISAHAKLTERRMREAGAIFGVNKQQKEQRKKKRVNNQTPEQEMRLMLRALDARETGASFSEIAKTLASAQGKLYKEQNRIGHRLHKAALKYQDIMAMISHSAPVGEKLSPPISIEVDE